jgi:hypothetical protein
MSDDEVEASGRHPSINVDSLNAPNGNGAASGSGVGTDGTMVPGDGNDGCGGGPIGGGMGPAASTNMNEELDNLMDISIEIASNKRMKKDHIKPFRLTFKDKELEKKVRTS